MSPDDVRLGMAPLPADATHRCADCPVGEFCLPLGLSPSELEGLDKIMRVSHSLPARQRLFRAGEPLTAIYAVRGGAFKATAVDCDGYEQVVGFHLPTELLGLDGIYSGIHHCDAVAVGASRVCIFPYSQLMSLAADAGALTRRLLQLLSKEIVSRMAVSGDYSADERLAAFLLGLCRRLPPRDQPKTRLVFPMLLADIANHLGLAGATLSRVLARFQDRELIRIENRVVHITDPASLRSLARRVPAISA